MADKYQPSTELWSWAHRSVDMVPHVRHLQHLATHVHSIIEWGIRSGVSTWALLDGLPADGTYFGVDNVDIREGLPARIREDPRVTIVIGDDREVELPDHADMVMIDSSHEYEHTLQELDIAVRLAPDMIVMHDYLFWSPDPAHGWHWCKVHQAVDKWLETGSYHIDHLYYSQWGLLVLVPN